MGGFDFEDGSPPLEDQPIHGLSWWFLESFSLTEPFRTERESLLEDEEAAFFGCILSQFGRLPFIGTFGTSSSRKNLSW